MDEKALNELLECSVCLDRLDSSSKVLPCQHTFCRWCLEEIVSTKKELRCPECRCLVEIKVSELPTNILLMRLLEGMKNAARSSGSSTKSSPSRVSDKTGSGPVSPAHCFAEGGPQSPSHKITDISNQPCAKALYSYEASEPGDLSFKKSDIILLRKQVDENWYHGEINGKHGFFPATYVQIVTQMSNKEVPACKALYDFTDKNEKDCLTFQKDVTMAVIRRVDDNWVEGKLGESIGIFPKSFVELNDAAKLLINFQASLIKANQNQTNDLNNQTRNHTVPTHPNVGASMSASVTSTSSADQSPSTSSHPIPPRPSPSTLTPTTSAHQSKPNNLNISHRSSNKRHSLNLNTLSPTRTSPPQMPNRHSMEVPSSVVLSSVTSTTTTTTSEVVPASPRNVSHNASSEGHSSPKSPISIYMSMYAYKPQKEDEMELQKGEYYSVTERCQDGWYKGVCLRTGVSGVFPGNYVQPLKMTPSKSSGIGVSRSPSCVSTPSSTSSLSSSSSSSSSSSNTTSAITSVTSTAHVAALNSTSRLSHVNVTRTHSFPKTSPLASMDYQARLRVQGLIRAGVAMNHPRPITNITQAQIRSTQSAANMTVAQSRAHSMLIPTSVIMATGTSSSPHQGEVVSEQDELIKTQSLPTGINPQQAYHNSQVALRAISATGNKHSPRSSRRHTHGDKCSKHSANQNSTSSTSGRHSYVGSSPTMHPSMSTNMNVTPPNVVIGATGGISQTGTMGGNPQTGATGGIPQTGAKDKEKKKERLPVSLMKKLSAGIPMRVRKSKSPIPDCSRDGAAASSSRHTHSQVAAPVEAAAAAASSSSRSTVSKSSTQSPNHHHRSGSAPLEVSPSRATGTSPAHMSHRKSNSVDSSHHSNGKPAKVKPLVRERYRCIVPYPPQSDMELELKHGDVVYVYKKRDDGWFKGTLQSSGKTGLFPGSFVQKC